MPTLINGLCVSAGEYLYHIDYGFPVGVEDCYIDMDDWNSNRAWLCLAHDWGLYNLLWWIEQEEEKRGWYHNFGLATAALESEPWEIYEHYDDIFSIAVYGVVKGYEVGENS